MTIKELISELKTFPDNYRIVFNFGQHNEYEIKKIEFDTNKKKVYLE